MSRRQRTTLIILGIAFMARLGLQFWDSGLLSPHPDERQVAFVAQGLDSWFCDPDFYAYGSLHFQAVRAAATVGGLPTNYAGLLVAGRTLSLFASMMAMLVGWWLASRAWGSRSANLALVLIALCPLDLQLSHFATVESHHALWVMIALAASFWTARSPVLAASITMGCAFGGSMAIKIASLPLTLCLFLALAIARQRTDWPTTLKLLSAAGAAACLSFWVGQPSAFTGLRPPIMLVLLLTVACVLARIAEASSGRARTGALVCTLLVLIATGGVAVTAAAGNSQLSPALNPDYLEGIGREIAMVSGRTDVPYVRVYDSTWPILYPLRELTLWAFGPALMLALFGALALGMRRLWRSRRSLLTGPLSDSNILLVLVLAWVVPVALRLATLQVKFLRYWELMVVPVCLLAGWWLARLRRPLRRRMQRIVAVGTLLWGLAYLWAFLSPHPHATASRWLNKMVDTSQIVAFEHWDETLRLLTPEGRIDTVTLESYQLPDDEAKVRRWCQKLAQADWVVFTSNRVRHTVMANPHRFPRTARLYELLLSGQAGFELVSRSDRAPRWFGLETPVQLADESFVNYDFPRVVILRRTAPTAIEDLVERSSSGPDPDFAAIERRWVEEAPEIPAPRTAIAQIGAVVAWCALFVLIGLATWALLAPLTKMWADGGLSLALVSGWIVCSWLLWFLSEASLVRVGGQTAVWIVLALAGCGSWAAMTRKTLLRRIVQRHRFGIAVCAASALAVWLFFLLVRAFNPAIFWGEKPMDFSFLNAFLRAVQWPPGEPWMAGEPLNYYYLGEVLASFPILATGVNSAVGYNLVVATIPALTAALLAAVGLTLASGRRRGLVLPLLVLFTGNLAWPFLLHLARDRRWFDMWWATSRVIPGFAIEEYPLWTAIFADLHGHFIALPVVLCGLAWGFTCLRLRTRASWMTAAGLCGLLAGVIIGCNPWDILIFTATLGIAVLTVSRWPIRDLGRLVFAAAWSVIVVLPFLVELYRWISGSDGGPVFLLNVGETAPAWAIARHFGLFLIPLATLAMSRLGKDAAVAGPLVVGGIFVGLAFDSSAAALALAAAALFLTVLGRAESRAMRLQWSLAGLAMLAVAFCERFTIFDRMNTIFKIYNSVWWLLAIALTIAVITCRGWRQRLLFCVWIPLQAVAMLNLPLAVAQGWLQPRISSPRPTLDGQAFLTEHDPQTWFLVQALLGAARPNQVLAEAAGDPYRNFTRLAMHTGQPTVVGWEHHLYQRGHPRRAIRGRFTDVAALYSSHDPVFRQDILDRYGIEWVALADVERQAYRLRDDGDFEELDGVIRFAQRDGAVLYRVVR